MTQQELCSDMCALLDALGLERALEPGQSKGRPRGPLEY